MKGSHKEMHKDYFLINGKIAPAEAFDPHEITKTTSVYEVIRIIHGIPLFLEEHLERLNQSFHLLGFDFSIDKKSITQQIHQLVEINKCYHYNLKLIVNNLKEAYPNIFLFFIESNYPSHQQYEKGIAAILYQGERENPNAKVILKSFRQQVQEALKAADAYEAILVDQHQQITEGSRSNIFLVKEDILYTAPAAKVLKGVTRNRIIDLCKSLKFSVVETPISLTFLREADGLFMTGTSPKVLPITSVDGKPYDSIRNATIYKVQRAYDAAIENYINGRIHSQS
ncbi:aminotransferase class IV [Clostridium formicaceticum]|uniref:Aminotransferase IV n=2 Tax=Clostridium formicaceticum TaxID=1497 RepID=A0AAC9WER4_9CLOT|nr:aminotransferase class IV [Clostridium formicaceticum]AOY78280.1 aminotransferase IV [Clostridium formicaceticum]ARE86011.1 Branched-chain-amino-acid aminotransferase [Clostridium formicaceticum]